MWRLLHRSLLRPRHTNTPVDAEGELRTAHVPFLTSHEKFTYYLNRVAPYVNETAFDHPFLSSRSVKPRVDVSEREIRRATAAYYGMVEGIDQDYGRVLQALEHVGQDLDDWIIIYTSDHGEMLGEHALWEKTKFFEGSVKVPLIIRLPGRANAGQVVEENVNLCDLFATLCELTGVPWSTAWTAAAWCRY